MNGNDGKNRTKYSNFMIEEQIEKDLKDELRGEESGGQAERSNKW